MAPRNLLAAMWMVAFGFLVLLPMSTLPMLEYPVLAIALPVWAWIVRRAMGIAVQALEPATL